MKLGDLKGERAVEVIADIIAPLSNISDDTELTSAFKEKRKEWGSDREAAAKDIAVLVPKLLKTHKADILAILCAVNDRKPEDLGVLDVLTQTFELIGDQDFMSLFIYAVNSAEPNQPTQSSAEQDRLEQE